VSRGRAARDIMRSRSSCAASPSTSAASASDRPVSEICDAVDQGYYWLEQSSDPGGDEKWVHQADGWILFMYIHIVLSGITVMLFSVAYMSAATFTNGWSTFVAAYVLVSIGFATVSLAAIITAFQDFITVMRAVMDGNLVKKIEVCVMFIILFVSTDN
jgi:hypothetical protein